MRSSRPSSSPRSSPCGWRSSAPFKASRKARRHGGVVDPRRCVLSPLAGSPSRPVQTVLPLTGVFRTLPVAVAQGYARCSAHWQNLTARRNARRAGRGSRPCSTSTTRSLDAAATNPGPAKPSQPVAKGDTSCGRQRRPLGPHPRHSRGADRRGANLRTCGGVPDPSGVCSSLPSRQRQPTPEPGPALSGVDGAQPGRATSAPPGWQGPKTVIVTWGARSRTRARSPLSRPALPSPPAQPGRRRRPPAPGAGGCPPPRSPTGPRR